jgi:hypothetical protein
MAQIAEERVCSGVGGAKVSAGAVRESFNVYVILVD